MCYSIVGGFAGYYQYAFVLVYPVWICFYLLFESLLFVICFIGDDGCCCQLLLQRKSSDECCVWTLVGGEDVLFSYIYSGCLNFQCSRQLNPFLFLYSDGFINSPLKGFKLYGGIYSLKVFMKWQYPGCYFITDSEIG